MPAAPGPLPRRTPSLVSTEPVEGPRNGGLGEKPERGPLASLVIKQAEDRVTRPVDVDVRK